MTSKPIAIRITITVALTLALMACTSVRTNNTSGKNQNNTKQDSIGSPDISARKDIQIVDLGANDQATSPDTGSEDVPIVPADTDEPDVAVIADIATDTGVIDTSLDQEQNDATPADQSIGDGVSDTALGDTPSNDQSSEDVTADMTKADSISDAGADADNQTAADTPIDPDTADQVLDPDTDTVTTDADDDAGPSAACHFDEEDDDLNIRINEVYPDSPDSDKDVFIELIGVPGHVVKGDVYVVFRNGASGKEVFTLNIKGQTFGSNGLMLLVDNNNAPSDDSTDAAVVKICDRDLECSDNDQGDKCICTTTKVSSETERDLQKDMQDNHECLLLQTKAQYDSFDEGDPTSTDNKSIDAVCWTDLASHTFKNDRKFNKWWFGEPYPYTDALTNSIPRITVKMGIGRIDCKDTDDNTQDFVPMTPSPGSSNVSE